MFVSCGGPSSSVDSDLGDISNLNDVQLFCNIADDANNLESSLLCFDQYR